MAIYLIRHGKTENPWVQHADSKLSALGHQQASALVESWSFPKPAKIVSSPLQRAMQTAQRLADHYEMEVEVMNAFTEIPAPEVGDPERGPFLKRLIDPNITWKAFDDGQVREWRETLVREAKGIPDQAAVFTHYATINALISDVQESELINIVNPENCSPVLFEFSLKSVGR